ncbi:MAG: DUF4124 domain-containing protein [Lysobacterales bacterium]
MRLATLALIGLFAAFSVAQSETIYKWQDENGVWHYDATKPKDQPVDQIKVRNRPPSTDTAAKPAEPSPESPNCVQARKNLDILNSNTQVSKDLDGDGKPENLTLDQHKQEIADAEQQIAAFCKPAKTP